MHLSRNTETFQETYPILPIGRFHKNAPSACHPRQFSCHLTSATRNLHIFVFFLGLLFLKAIVVSKINIVGRMKTDNSGSCSQLTHHLIPSILLAGHRTKFALNIHGKLIYLFVELYITSSHLYNNGSLTHFIHLTLFNLYTSSNV